MKKIISLAIVISVSVLAQMIVSLPWWSFLIPVFLLGIALPLKKWKISSFQVGFVAGFLVWCLYTLYFETSYKGDIINKTGRMLGVSVYLMYAIIGCIGGLLTALALYSGFLLRRGKELLHLELQ